MKMMCVNCGNIAIEGSMKHPYCKKCFTEIWNDDYDKYIIWLNKTH